MSSFTFTTTPSAPATRGFTFDPELLPNTPEGEAIAQRIYDLITPYAEQCQLKRESDISNYSSEHEALVMERRKLADREQELQSEQTVLEAEALEIDNGIRTALFNLRVIRGNPPQAMWSTKADWDAHNSAIADATKVLEEAQARQQDYNQRVAEWREDCIEVQDLIKNLAESVAKVWVRLQAARGTKVHAINPDTGLRQ